MAQTNQTVVQRSAVDILRASDCALHNSPAMEPEPCDCDTQNARIVHTLIRASLALSASNNVLATDRPNLPLTPETSWTTNHEQEIRAIHVLLGELGVDLSQPLAVTKT